VFFYFFLQAVSARRSVFQTPSYSGQHSYLKAQMRTRAILSRVKSVFKPRSEKPVQQPIRQGNAHESSSSRCRKPKDRGPGTTTPSNATSSDWQLGTGSHVDDPGASANGEVKKRKTDFGDSDRYTMAVTQLKNCLADSLTLRKFDFLNIDELQSKDDIAYLRDEIDEMLQCRNSQAKNRTFIRNVFTAIAPLSKVLLTVMTQSQPVLTCFKSLY
jgi:hypothetical protein